MGKQWSEGLLRCIPPEARHAVFGKPAGCYSGEGGNAMLLLKAPEGILTLHFHLAPQYLVSMSTATIFFFCLIHLHLAPWWTIHRQHKDFSITFQSHWFIANQKKIFYITFYCGDLLFLMQTGYESAWMSQLCFLKSCMKGFMCFNNDFKLSPTVHSTNQPCCYPPGQVWKGWTLCLCWLSTRTCSVKCLAACSSSPGM